MMTQFYGQPLTPEDILLQPDHPNGMTPCMRALRQVLAERDELQRRENNFFTYGDGGAGYWESQYLDRLRGQEERAEIAEASLAAAIARAEQQLQRLRSALKRYGQHEYRCARLANEWIACTCGLDDALRAAALAAADGGEAG